MADPSLTSILSPKQWPLKLQVLYSVGVVRAGDASIAAAHDPSTHLSPQESNFDKLSGLRRTPRCIWAPTLGTWRRVTGSVSLNVAGVGTVEVVPASTGCQRSMSRGLHGTWDCSCVLGNLVGVGDCGKCVVPPRSLSTYPAVSFPSCVGLSDVASRLTLVPYPGVTARLVLCGVFSSPCIILCHVPCGPWLNVATSVVSYGVPLNIRWYVKPCHVLRRVVSFRRCVLSSPSSSCFSSCHVTSLVMFCHAAYVSRGVFSPLVT